MNWEEIDKIERDAECKFEPRERRKIPPSVEKIISDFDEWVKEGEVLTEATFHQDNEKVTLIPQRNYLQKALRTTLRWQQFCQTNT